MAARREHKRGSGWLSKAEAAAETRIPIASVCQLVDDGYLEETDDNRIELSKLVAYLLVQHQWLNISILMKPTVNLPPETWRELVPNLSAYMRQVGILRADKKSELEL